MMAKSDNGDLNISSSASDTNDPNNSFMKKVTKHVSGLLPSSLSKWFGPSDRETAVRRRSSRDEDEQESLQAQPPKKRAKLPPDAGFSASNSFAFSSSTPLVHARADLRHLQPGPSGYSRHQATATEPTQPDATHTAPHALVNGDDKSDSDDSESASAPAPVPAPAPPTKPSETIFCFDAATTPNQPQITKTALNKSLNTSLSSSRSLFSEHSLNPKRPCLSSRRPSFNASTFGSPSFVDRTLSTNRVVNSPFYGRRTIYGGASAYRKNRVLFPRDDSNNLTVKNSVQVKPVNETKSDTESMHLSKTARRILDVLESFSTPVSDARKIPPITRPQDQSASTSRLAKTPYSRETKTVPKKQLIVPGVPDLLKMKMKERIQESTEQVRKVATTSKSVLNSEYSIRKEEEAKPQKHVSKMRTKVSAVRDKQPGEADTVDAVKLPEVQLPITNLPKFDFTLPPPESALTKPTETIKKPPEIIKTNANAPSSSHFKFADPIIICTSPKITTSVNSFKFSEPLSSKSNNQSAVVSNATPAFTFKGYESSTAPKRKDPPKNNGQNSELGFTLQPPKELLQGSVMDVLGKPEKKEEKKDSLMDKFKPAVGSWECTMCMVRNEAKVTRCVACESPKEPVKKVETATGFGSQFKMSTDKWECSACLVRNDNAETKCVACTTPKPGAKPATTTNNFGDKFKPPADTWECSECLIRNKADVTKCAACETPKPGTKTTATTTNSLVLPAEPKQSSSFADFIKKQQEQWECSSCAVRNSADKTKCACCEAAKPGAEIKFGTTPSASTFKFGVEGTGFSFGVPKTDATPPPTFTFGVKPADKQPDTKATTIAPTTTGFTFGIPPASKSTEAPSLFSAKAVVSSTSSAEPTKTQTITFSSTTTAAVAATTSAPTFSFGTAVTSTQNSSPKPSFNFGAVSTAAPTAATFSTPSTKATSMFGLPTATSSAAVTNIFGNAATTITTSTSSSTTTVSAESTAISKAPSATTLAPAFSFEAPSQSKPVFGAAKSISVPQFNFGAGGLPFNPVAAVTTSSSSAAVTSTTSSGAQSTQPFVFNFQNNATPAPVSKPEVKPFGFEASEPAKSAFSFAPNKKPAPAPLSKVGVFNFGAGASADANTKEGFGAVTSTAGSTFEFGAPKSESAFGAVSSSSATPAFSAPAQTSAPQNGGFNFGANMPAPNFNFTSNNNSNQAAIFAFGASQAGSGAGAGATGTDVFQFGGASTSTAQQTPTFSPDVKPNFNFTGGTIPVFSAPEGWNPSAAVAARRTRKAVRRVQR